jgi:hypothetical protein
MVKVDPLLSDAEIAEDLTLNGEVLLPGRAACVPINMPAGGADGRFWTVPAPNSMRPPSTSDASVSIIAALTTTTARGKSPSHTFGPQPN